MLLSSLGASPREYGYLVSRGSAGWQPHPRVLFRVPDLSLGLQPGSSENFKAVKTRRNNYQDTGLQAEPVPGSPQPVPGPSGANGANPGNGTIRTTPRTSVQSESDDDSLVVLRVSPAVPSNVRGGRMRWTRDNNLLLMRAYFTATRLEQNLKGYRTKLKSLWDELGTGIDRSEQQLSDQARSILRRGVLSAPELESLKREAALELGINSINELSPQRSNVSPATAQRRSINRRSTLVPLPTTDLQEQKILDSFNSFRMRFEGVAPQYKPPFQSSHIINTICNFSAKSTS